MKTAGGVATCIALAVALVYIFLSSATLPPPMAAVHEPFTTVLWQERILDIVGQLLMIMAGTFGVLVLVKERIQQ